MIRKFLFKQIKKQISSTPVGKQVVETIWGKDHSLTASFGKPSSLMSPHGQGFCLDGKNFLSIEKSRENYLVVAPSGKGKTQVSVFPFLLNAKGNFSIIVNDPSGELSQTIPCLQSVGYQCHILDFGKKKGVNFNPLDICSNRTQIMKVAKTLMSSTAKEKEDFFTLAGEDCIALFIQYIKESEPYEFQNLGNVYYLLLEYQANPHVIENLVATKGSEDVFRKFRALAGNSQNTLKSIVATALASLSFVGSDPTLSDITSRTNISFEEFRRQPHALFVHVPIGDIKHYASMVSLFFQGFYKFAFSYLPSEQERDIFCILDEFDTMGAIGDYSTIISNARKFKIPQQIILQSEALLSKYGENSKNILNNCNVKCYYGGLTHEIYDLQRILGNYDYNDKKTGSIRQRPLMTASEIREMTKDEILIIPSGDKPLKVHVTPAYKQPELVRKLNLRSQNPQPVENFTVSYIDLTPFR